MSSPAASQMGAFIRVGFLRLLAFRLRYVTGILTYTLNVSIYYFIWRAVYAHTAPGAPLRGYELADIITYVALGWSIRSFYFNNIDREIATLVTEGHITLYMARPVNLLHAMTSLAAGESLFRITAFTGPISVAFFFLFPIHPPISPIAFLAFVLSAVMSFLLLVYINFMVGLISFLTQSIMGILSAKHYAIQLLSGLLMPLAFFPDWLRTLSMVLPFRHIAHTPVALYLGRTSETGAGTALAVQALWVVLFYGLARLTWSRMMRRLVIQGG